MTVNVKEVQQLLAKTGHSPGTIDGIWGPRSQAAMDAALGKSSFDALVETTVKPVTSASKVDWWKDIRYFNRSEFRCKCGKCGGYPVEPSESLVRLLDKFRTKCGTAVVVGSGIRCKAHNAAVAGASQSQHLYGTAADLYCSGKTPAQMAAIAEKLLGDSGGIGIYSWGIHIDVRAVKARWRG